MARDKIGARKPAAINAGSDAGLSGGDAHLLGLAGIMRDDPHFAPVIGNLQDDVSHYHGGDGAVLLDAGGDLLVTDGVSANFEGGILTVSIGQSAFGDVLSVVNNPGTTQISGGNVIVGGFVIGTVMGGTDGTPLSFALNDRATPARVQILMRALTYENSEANPDTHVRDITYSLAGPMGTASATSQVDFPGTLSFYENVMATEGQGPDIVEFPFVVVRLGGTTGDITVTWTLNAPGGAGQADSADFDPGQAMSGTVTILDGDNSATIVIHLRGDLDIEADELFTLTLSDPTGGAVLGGAPAQGTILDDDAPNQPPVVTNFEGDSAAYTFSVNSFVLLDVGTDSTVSDPDSADFDGGTLSVSFGAGQVAGEDMLFLVENARVTFGTGVPGGLQLLVDGVEIGTYGSPPPGGPLQISFNSAATAAAVTLVLQAIAYGGNVDLGTATPGVRDIAITLTDGDGGSTDLSSSVTVSLPPLPPVYVDLDGNTAGFNYSGLYIENDPGAAIGNNVHIGAQGPNLFFLIVEITDGQFGDQLTYNAAFAGGLSVQASPTQLQFIGLRSVGQYEALLASIRYFNTTEDPNANGNFDRVISVQVSDPQAAQNSALSYATITVVGVNDIANLSGPHTASIAEEGGHAEGKLTVTDLDPGQDQVNAYFTRGDYGAFAVAGDGSWSYDGDFNNQLRAGETLTDTFTVTSVDGSASIDVVITIVGANDVPDLFLPEDGDIGTVVEDDFHFSFAQGFVGCNDADTGESSWTTGNLVTAYGTFTVDTDTGAWLYVLNNDSVATQGLHDGQTVVDQLLLTSFDGTLTHTLKVTITGASDDATIGGTIAGDVTEDTHVTTTGTLIVSDGDSGDNEVQAIIAGTAGANGYGTFEVLANGNWTYTLNNALPAVQALDSGQSLTDTILVTSKDGSDTETITVTIHGRTEGANAEPVLDHPIPDQHSNEDMAVNYQVPANSFSDADGDTLTYSAALTAGGALPGWLHFDAATRTFSGTPPQDFNGTIAVRVTATDGLDSAFDDFNLIIDPVPDFATGTSNTVAATEDATYTFTFADFGYSDPDGDAMAGVYIHTDDSSDGLVSLNGVALHGTSNFVSIADLNSGLLTFRAPLNANGDDFATFGFQVVDVTGNSTGLDQTTRTMTIDVAAVDDPLIITVPASDVTFTEGAAAVTLDSGITITDVDGPATIDRAAVVISGGFVAGEDLLTWDTAFAAAHGITGVLTDETLTFTGTANLADYQTLLRSVAYLNTNNGNPDTGDREITFGAGPGGGGISHAQGLGGINNAQQPGVDHIVTVHVVGTPDFATGTSNTVTTNEDIPYVFSFADFGYSDPDGDAMAGVYIHTNDSSDGLVYLNGVALHGTSNFVTIADINNGLLTFASPPNANGDDFATFGFQVVDTTGNTTGLDQTTRTMTIDVNSVNDAPDASPVFFTIPPGGSHRLSIADFGFSDVDGNHITGIKITGVIQGTSILFDGDGLPNSPPTNAVGLFIPIAQISDLYAQLSPTGGAFGPSYGFTFTVMDDGGTDHGGVDTSGTRTIFFSVVAHPPVVDQGVADFHSGEDNAILYSFAPNAFADQDGDPLGYSAQLVSGLPLPAWLLFDSATRTFSGTPPQDFNGTLSIRVTASDGSGSVTDDFDLIIDPVNDAPLLDASKSPTMVTINEDPGAPSGAVGTLVSVLVDSATPAGGLDSVTDVDSGAQLGLAITGFNPSGTLYYSLDGGAHWTQVLITFSNSSALLLAADANTRIYFRPGLDFNGAIDDAITFRAWDQSSGIAGSLADTTANGGTTAFSTNTDTASLFVNAVDDAPVLDASKSPTMLTINEDPGIPSGAVGTPISNLVDFATPAGGLDNVTDPDAGAVLGIAITAVNPNGTLYFSVNGGATWSAVPAVTASSAFLLRPVDLVYFQPATNFNGTIADAFTFRAWDQRSGSVASFGDTTFNGGATAFSAATDIVSLTVNPVNDAPSGTDKAVTINEDNIYTFVTADFGFSDLADGNAFGWVVIKSLPTAGTLFFDQDGPGGLAPTSVNVGLHVAVADIIAGHLYFQSNANAAGTPYASFTFAVQDDGGTANGGVDEDATPNTFTINVNAVNDAPVNSVPGAQSTNEDTARIFSTGNGNAITVSDLDVGGGNLTVTLTVAHGTLTLSGIAGLSFNAGANGSATMTITGTAAAINTALNGLSYAPTANYNGPDSLQIQTSDNGNSGTGGALTDTDNVAITVVSVNDAPSGTSNTITVNEDTIYAFTAADFGFSDPVDGNALGWVVIKSLSLGTLYFDQDGPGGIAPFLINVGLHISVADINAGHFYFQAPPDANGASYAAFTFAVQDDGGTANGGVDEDQTPNLFSINVAAVNDAPVNSVPGAQSTNEDTSKVFSSGNGNAISVSDVDATTLTVTLTVAHGTLTLSGIAGLSFGAGANGTATMTISGTAAAINTALNGLTYAPTANYNGPDAIQIQTSDNGQTGIGGTQTDSDSVAITVVSVNDAPSGTDKTLTGSEDDPVVFSAADFGFSDPADGNSLLAVKITSLPGIGTLFLDPDGIGGPAPGVAVNAGDIISLSDINAGHLYFLGAQDGFGSPYASFTFQVRDNGGTANGGVDLDQSANTITINLTPDNLPPVVDLNGVAAGIDYVTSYTEDGAPIGIGAGLIVSDPNSGTGDMIESAKVMLTDRVTGDSLTFGTPLPAGFNLVTTNAAGSITLQISGTGTVAQYQAILSSIVYATTNQDPTVGGTDLSRTITVTVNDGTVDSAVATTTVNINAVDDAPVAQPDAFTITESGTISGASLFASNGSGADADPDGPSLAISAVNGSGANVGTQIALASGALLKVNVNGTFDYNPNGAFLSTPTAGSGASNTPAHDSFTYTLAGGNTVTVSITLTGLDTDDLLFGTAGADMMMGGIGNDTLVGLGGADVLIGGTGNDVYFVDTAGDQVVEAAGGGNDTVYASATYALAAGQEVEALSTIANYASDAIDLYGNELSNLLIGNAGVNVLFGGAGADLLVGLGGNDVYYVDNAGDQILEGASGGNDTVYTSVSYALAAGVEVEALSTIANYATDAINLTGNELANLIIGNAGANVLFGGGGADIMYGFGGNDVYYVDNAGDMVGEAVGGGIDTVYTSASYALAAGQEVEALSTINNFASEAIDLTGNELANLLIGNAGSNFLDGKGGADVLYGFGGSDTFAFTTALGGGNVDTIADFAHGIDKIGLDDALFAGIGTSGGPGVPGIFNASSFVVGTAAGDGDDRIIYNSATGQLLYDADGTGVGAAVQFATLQPGLTITASDFVVI